MGGDVTALLFDRHLVRQRLARAVSTGPAEFLLGHATSDIVERLDIIKRDFARVLDLGTPLPDLARHLAARTDAPLVVRLAPSPMTLGGAPLLAFVGDEEALPIGGTSFDLAGFDLVVSALALQSVNDLPGALIQLRRVLRPDGLFLGCLLGGQSLHELRTVLAVAESELTGGISPRVAPFADVRDMGALLQRAGFALPVVDSEPLVARYDSLFGLMADLRAMGMTNPLEARARHPARRDLFMRAAKIYAERFADPDGRVRATFELIHVSGWVPHESQQKPLRPGSANIRLADVLSAVEPNQREEP